MTYERINARGRSIRQEERKGLVLTHWIYSDSLFLKLHQGAAIVYEHVNNRVRTNEYIFTPDRRLASAARRKENSAKGEDRNIEHSWISFRPDLRVTSNCIGMPTCTGQTVRVSKLCICKCSSTAKRLLNHYIECPIIFWYKDKTRGFCDFLNWSLLLMSICWGILQEHLRVTYSPRFYHVCTLQRCLWTYQPTTSYNY